MRIMAEVRYTIAQSAEKPDCGMQISNIGSEVHRAIRWKNKQETGKMTNFCNKAIELLELTERDLKNRHRIGELDYALSAPFT